MLSAMAAVSSASHSKIYSLTKDWQVHFDASDCSLIIDKHVDGQGVSRVRMFESDKHLLSTGVGDVDILALKDELMKAGNIKKFPQRVTKSDHMECQEA